MEKDPVDIVISENLTDDAIKSLLVEIVESGNFPDDSFDIRHIEKIHSFQITEDGKARFATKTHSYVFGVLPPYVPRNYYELDLNTREVTLIKKDEIYRKIRPDLELVNFGLERRALKAWEEGNIMRILYSIPDNHGLAWVFDNIWLLLDIGKYEEALLEAYTSTKTNWSSWSLNVLNWMFAMADTKNLTQAGDPIPDKELFTLYRGVGGTGRQRRVTSFSWTESLDKAIWFAERAKSFGLNDPAVFTLSAPREKIVAYINDRDERECILELPLPGKPKRVRYSEGRAKDVKDMHRANELQNLRRKTRSGKL